MAMRPSTSPPPKPYDLLAIHLQRAINNPTAQKNKTALLEQLESDYADAWQQIMAELGKEITRPWHTATMATSRLSGPFCRMIDRGVFCPRPLHPSVYSLPFFGRCVPAGFPSPAADHLEKHIP
jgi:hypothetical protein